MSLRVWAVVEFQPVLLGEGQDGGLVVNCLPEDAEKRGEILFLFPRWRIYTSRGVGIFDAPGFGPSAKAEIVKWTARGRRELPMGDLVKDDAGFGTAADAVAVP